MVSTVDSPPDAISKEHLEILHCFQCCKVMIENTVLKVIFSSTVLSTFLKQCTWYVLSISIFC